jgi:hypothetical protein
MEKSEQRVLEALIAFIFLILLILVVVLAVSYYGDGKTTKQTYSSSGTSYAVYSPQKSEYRSCSSCGTNCPQPKSGNVICEEVRVPYTVTTGPSTTTYETQSRNIALSYTMRTEEKQHCNIVGRTIKEYYVYVKNTDYQGGYYTVKFYMYDHYGNEQSDSMYEYINPGQERQFRYTQLREDFSVEDWDYKIETETRKIPSVSVQKSGMRTETKYKTETKCYYNGNFCN